MNPSTNLCDSSRALMRWLNEVERGRLSDKFEMFVNNLKTLVDDKAFWEIFSIFNLFNFPYLFIYCFNFKIIL